MTDFWSKQGDVRTIHSIQNRKAFHAEGDGHRMKNRHEGHTMLLLVIQAQTHLASLWENWHLRSHGGEQELPKGMGVGERKQQVQSECVNHCTWPSG